ncbi:MAG: multi-sensor signal transduction histidine kinase [Deferribacteraceae bacterium]|nr:multi-sensor signal transduction histidine kinase [Deferribacteraceae bacterium]
MFIATILIVCAFIGVIIVLKYNYEKEFEKNSYERLNNLNNQLTLLPGSVYEMLRHSLVTDINSGDDFKNLRMNFYDDELLAKVYLIKGEKFILGLSKYDIISEVEDDIDEDLRKVVTFEDGELTLVKEFFVDDYNIIYYMPILKILQTYASFIPFEYNLGVFDKNGKVLFFSDYSAMFGMSAIKDFKNNDFAYTYNSLRVKLENSLTNSCDVYFATYGNSKLFENLYVGIFVHNKVIETYLLKSIFYLSLLGIFIFLIAVVFIYFYSRRFSKPLERLANIVGGFPNSFTDYSLHFFPDNEVRLLASKFKDVAANVKGNISKNEELLKKLETQSNLLIKMLDFLPSDIVLIEREYFKIKYINKNFLKNTDSRLTNVTGEQFFSLFCNSEKKDKLVKLFSEIEEPRFFYSIDVNAEFGIKHVSKCVNLNVVPVGLEFIMLIIQDVQREMEAVEVIKAQKMLIESYFDAIPEMAFIKDKNLRYVDVNKSFIEFTGFKRDFVKGLRETDIYPLELAEYIIQKERWILENRKPLKYEIELSKGNKKRIVEVYKTPLINEYGEVEFIVGVARDITEYKNFTNEIEKQKNILSNVIDSLREGIIVLDENKNIIYANEFLKSLIFCGDSFFKLEYLEDLVRFMPDESMTEFTDKLDTLINDDNISKVYGRINIFNMKHEYKDLFYVGLAVKFNFTRERMFVLTFRDETEMNLILNKLAVSERSESITKIIGGLTHDFKNMLSAIYNYLMIYTLEFQLDEVQKGYIENVFRVLNKARYLSEELLGITKGGTKKEGISNIKDVAEEVGLFVFSGTEIVFENNIHDDIWNVLIDANQLSQILHNLFLNAVQAIDGVGKVSVNAQNMDVENDNELQPGKYVKLIVEDTGKGIEKDILEKIFEPYFTTKEKGSGLGLFIIKSLIEKASGKITIDSEVGKGTKVEIYLKSSGVSDSAKRGHEVVINKTSSKKYNVIIVDDQIDILDSLKGLLEIFGCNVRAAKDSDDGVTLLNKFLENGERVDLIITDLTIPGGKGGLDLLDRVKKIDKNIPIVLMSGYADSEEIKKYLSYGFKSILSKPFDVEEINKILESI